MQHTIGKSEAFVKDDMPANQLIITCNIKDSVSELYKLDRRDELVLYSSIDNYNNSDNEDTKRVSFPSFIIPRLCSCGVSLDVGGISYRYP